MQSARQDLQSLTARVLQGAAPEEAVPLAWPHEMFAVLQPRQIRDDVEPRTIALRHDLAHIAR